MDAFCTDELMLMDIRNLEDLHFTVPMQTNTKESYRRYCLIKYLELLGEGKLVSFPMVIKNTETPDFIMIIKGKTISIKQTMTSAWVHDRSSQSHLGSQLAFTQLGKVEHSELAPKLSLGMEGEDSIFLWSGERMISHRWTGDESQLEWVKAQADAIEREVVKLHKGAFNLVDETELLIFDNTYVSVYIQPEEMMCNLTAELKERSLSHSGFDRISIITKNKLMYDIENRQLILTER